MPGEEKTDEMKERIAFTPVEVHVWPPACDVAQVEQQGRDSIGDRRGFRSQDSVRVDHNSPHDEYIAKVRSIANAHFQKENRLLRVKIEVPALVRFVGRVVARTLESRVMSEQVKRMFAEVGQETASRIVEFDSTDS
jgi:hypothetical protein